MSRRFFYVSLGILALPALWPVAAEAAPPAATEAYLDGALISVRFRLIPEGAAASLASRGAELDDFFDGAIWLCVAGPDSNEFACFLDHTTPVLKSAPKNSLLQARQIFWMPGRTPRDLKSWDQIEEAVASGDILLTEERGIYRSTILRDHDAVAGKSTAETATWGQVKSIFR